MKILNIYILKQFLATLFFALIALCVIFLVVNLLENLDSFLDQNATFEIIVKYYIYFFPEILKLLTPIATLMATLFSIGKLSTANEITAMKSGGMSLYGIIKPLVIVSLMISFVHLFFNGWIVPEANQIKLSIEKKYLNRDVGGTPIFNLQFRDNPQRNVLMQYYDSYVMSGNRVTIEDYSSEVTPRLVKRIEASKILWDTVNSRWKLVTGNERDYTGNQVQVKTFDTMNVVLKMQHKQIMQLQRSPDEMNFDDFKNYIDLLKQGGKDVSKQLIEYHGNYAFPFANLIVILFGVPFASIRKKGGIAIQIGAAMVISFFYLVFTKISQTIGYTYNVNPIIAAWSANIIFLTLALVNLYKTRT